VSKNLKWILGAGVLVAVILVIILVSVPREEPIVEEPIAEEPAVEEPAVDEPAAEDVEEPQEEVTVVEFRQSPFLDARDLPPVVERLPIVPKIANELPEAHLAKEIGTFGGTLRLVTMNIDWDADLFVAMNEPLINSPGVRGEEFTPNILESFEVSPDQTMFTFTLREGLRWSDGELVTTEDVRFAVENVLLNTTLTPTFPGWLRTGADPLKSPGVFDFIDDHTFSITFEEPYGGFLAVMSIQGWRGYTDLIRPAHYLQQYHVDFTPLADLEPMIAEEGFEPGEWHRLFLLRDINDWESGNRLSVGFPVLRPWKMVEVVEGAKVTLERNPYYFKVDAAGNQLPYIDRIESHLVEDMEMILMRILGGEVDLNREDATMINMPLYRENEQRGGFRALLSEMHVTPTHVFLNLSNTDENWRQVVNDVRFRRALSLAMDREEIIETLYFGHAILPSDWADPTFDVAEANRLLDEMGLELGSDGYRTGPDGNRFVIPFEITEHAPDMVPLVELLTEMWKEIGIHVTIQTMDATLWGTRNTANELFATIMWQHGPMWPNSHWDQNFWAPIWHLWHTTGGVQGEEPPAEVKEFYNLLSEIFVVPIEQHEQVWDQIKESRRENVWAIVTAEQVRQPLIVSARLGNVTDQGWAIALNFSAEQLFFRE